MDFSTWFEKFNEGSPTLHTKKAKIAAIPHTDIDRWLKSVDGLAKDLQDLKKAKGKALGKLDKIKKKYEPESNTDKEVEKNDKEMPKIRPEIPKLIRPEMPKPELIKPEMPKSETPKKQKIKKEDKPKIEVPKKKVIKDKNAKRDFPDNLVPAKPNKFEKAEDEME